MSRIVHRFGEPQVPLTLKKIFLGWLAGLKKIESGCEIECLVARLSLASDDEDLVIGFSFLFRNPPKLGDFH